MQKVLLAAHRGPAGSSQEQPVSKPRPPIPCSCPHPAHLCQAMAGTRSEVRNGSRGTTSSFTPPEAAAGGAQLTRAQPVSTDNHPLPTSTGNTIPPTQKPWKRHAHTITVRISRQLLPMELRNHHTPAAAGKAEHKAHKEKSSDYQFIRQRCSKLASCLQDWMATPRGITKSCGST